MRRRDGVTLTEILVVLVIIGILAAILLPALAVGRAKARQTACASNLRQMGLAFALYAGDWRNVLPHEDASIPAKAADACGVGKPALPPLCASGLPAPYDDNGDCPYCWFFALNQYLRLQNADRLAEAKQDPIYRNIADTPAISRDEVRTIKMNTNLEDPPVANCEPRFRDMGTLASPTRTVLLFDGQINDANVARRYDAAITSVDWRHSGGANFLFISGRVAWEKKKRGDALDDQEADHPDLIWTP